MTPDDNSLMELSLISIKKKAIDPVPLFSSEQQQFMAKLQVKLKENKQKRSQTKLNQLSRNSLLSNDNSQIQPVSDYLTGNLRYGSITTNTDDVNMLHKSQSMFGEENRRKSYVQMFDDPLERDPQNLTFEETFENLDLLNRRLVQKLNDAGLDHDYELTKNKSKATAGKRNSILSSLKLDNNSSTSIIHQAPDESPILLKKLRNSQ